MKPFQLSQRWMASEAKGAFFGAVKLSVAHSERLRVMLLHDEPGDEERHTASERGMILVPVDFVRLKRVDLGESGEVRRRLGSDEN